MRIIELPLPLCAGEKISLAVLLARESLLAVGHAVFVGNTYDFTGEIEPTSFALLMGHNRFAQHGVLLVEYPESALTIDDDLGLVVQLDGVDTLLDEQTAFNALADEFLVFVDDEILSVSTVELLGVGLYRLKVVRSRMTTVKATHADGADVYLIARADLLPLTHEHFKVGNSIALKVVAQIGRQTQDLADVEATAYAITGDPFKVAPLNLRVNKSSEATTIADAVDLLIEWSLPDARKDLVAAHGIKYRTLVEILLAADDSVLWKKLTYPAYLKMSAAKLATVLGSETEFKVRISTDGRGRDYQFNSATLELGVTKV